MRLDPAPWLALARALGPGHERGALDPRPGTLEDAAAALAARDWPGTARVLPWGLDLEAGTLWEPWKRSRDAVELCPEDPQERGARADALVHDPAEGTVTLVRVGAWAPGCPRFRERACPRMAPMGHESAHAECNYWAWEPMAAAAPGVELFPEWQRFDCHRDHALFQWHLCGAALGKALGARPGWLLLAPEASRAGLAAYAALTSAPGDFRWAPLP